MIKYRKLTKEEKASCNGRYKYELTDGYAQYGIDLGPKRTGIYSYLVYDELVELLVIRAGYWWDGPSFIAIDTPDFMRGSLVHDALYQLMREGKLSKKYRKYADKLCVQICKEDGMAWWRRGYVYWFLRAFAAGTLKPEVTRQSGNY